jgi:aminoglycoside 3-N-acetyltransferase I
MTFQVRQLGPQDMAVFHALLDVFGEAFSDAPNYRQSRPSAAYLTRLLGGDTFIALAALQGTQVVGGIAAYELRKFEQERSAEVLHFDIPVTDN